MAPGVFHRPIALAGRWVSACCDLLFPARCVHCDADLGELRHGQTLCPACRDLLAPPDWSYCRRCGAGVPPGGESTLCGMCRGVRLAFDRVVSLGPYRGPLGAAVVRMKSRRGDGLSRAVGRLLCQRQGEWLAATEPDVVVPVPMHWTRRIVRGTNSPDILAGMVACHLGAPLADRMLYRCRNTFPQTRLRPRERMRNVRGAFRLRTGYDLDDLRVLLVDDILTTGATCSDAAKALKRAGASMVAVAVLARGTGDSPQTRGAW